MGDEWGLRKTKQYQKQASRLSVGNRATLRGVILKAESQSLTISKPWPETSINMFMVICIWKYTFIISTLIITVKNSIEALGFAVCLIVTILYSTIIHAAHL